MAQVKKKQTGPGRPAIGKTAMTAAERSRKLREQMKAEGIVERTVKFNAKQLKNIEKLAKKNGVSNKAMIEDIIEAGINTLL